MDDLAFAQLFREHAPRVYAYARRHIAIDQCEDVVSQTFLHAGRRRGDLPAEPLPWLLVTARHTIHNRTRGQRRAESLW